MVLEWVGHSSKRCLKEKCAMEAGDFLHFPADGVECELPTRNIGSPRVQHICQPTAHPGLTGEVHRSGECYWQSRILRYPQYSRSRLRYCTASATCLACTASRPARSAIVRATFRIRSWDRALSPNFRTAISSVFSLAGSSADTSRTLDTGIWELINPHLSCTALACSTRARIVSVVSPVAC